MGLAEFQKWPTYKIDHQRFNHSCITQMLHVWIIYIHLVKYGHIQGEKANGRGGIPWILGVIRYNL